MPWCDAGYCSWLGDDEYSVHLEPTARNVWALRTYRGPEPGYDELDDWVGAATVRAERFVWDKDLDALSDSDEPRPYAHVFLTMGDYPKTAQYKMKYRLRDMGFVWTYHERAVTREGVRGLLVKVTDLRTMRQKSTFVPKENKDAKFPLGYFDPSPDRRGRAGGAAPQRPESGARPEGGEVDG